MHRYILAMVAAAVATGGALAVRAGAVASGLPGVTVGPAGATQPAPPSPAVPGALGSGLEAPETWTQKALITFAGYDRPETLTNFVALVTLGTNVPGFDYGTFLSGPNADLRFVDASRTNELAYEVEQWNTNGLSTVWVQVPRLESSGTAIWAYWGRAGETAPAYTTNGAAWSQDFQGVWHLGQTNGAGRLPNSAGALHGGTNVGGAAAVAGLIGTARSFNGSNQRIDLGPMMPNGPYTKTVWFSVAATNVNNNLLSGANNTHALYFSVGSKSLRSGHNGSFSQVVDPQSVGISNWAFGAVTFDGLPGNPGTMILYRDGLEVSRSNGVPARSASAMDHIGAYNGTSYFAGLIDEAEVSSVARSSNWIWAGWANQSPQSGFQTVEVLSPTIGHGDVTGVAADAATLNGYLVSAGGAPTTVTVYYGTVDGGTDATAWAASVTLAGTPAAGPVAVTVNVAPGGVYWCRYHAANAFGEHWAPFSTPFMTGEVGLQAVDADASESGPDAATFSVYRPDWATGVDLIVNYTVAGSASNGVDFTRLSGSVTLPAGATNALVVLAPLPDTEYFESAETAVVSLAAGAYLVGPVGVATATIANLQPDTVAVVSGAGDDATGDGSYASPFRSITRALANSPAYPLVYVGTGTYTTNNGEVFPLDIPAGTSLIGLGGPDDAILDCGRTNGLRLTGAGTTNLISNLRVVGTRGTVIVALGWQGTVDNVVITDTANGGVTNGGVLLIYYNNTAARSVTFSRLVVTNVSYNLQKLLHFTGTGGNLLFTNCTFRGITMTTGASQAHGNLHFGSSGFNTTLADCLFESLTFASSTSAEGGVFYNGNSGTTLFSVDRCVFRNITVTGANGAGIYLPNRIGSQNYARVRDCLFQNVNCGTGLYSGAISSFGGAPGVRNCTFQNVSAVLRPSSYGTPVMAVYNSIISDCTRLSMAQVDYVHLFNVNIVNTGPGVGYNVAASTNVTALAPWFADAAAGDLRLRTFSPLVDAGNNGYVLGSPVDLGGNVRLRDGNADGTVRVDLGAYESDFDSPAAPRFRAAFPLYRANAGQGIQVPVWIQPAATGPVTAAVTYGTNTSGPATLDFATGSETVTLAITVSSPLAVPNGALVPVTVSEAAPILGVAAGDVGLSLFSSVVTLPGYQARTFVRAGVTNLYRVQLPAETLAAATDLTVTAVVTGGAGANDVRWTGSNVITAGGWRTEGWLQVVGGFGENTITLGIGGGMTFHENGGTELPLAFVGYDSPLHIAPTGSDTTGAGTPSAPLQSLTFAVPLLRAGDEVLLAAGVYSTNTGEVFPIAVPEGIVVRGVLGAAGNAQDSSVIDADGTGFDFLLGTLGTDPGFRGAGGLYNLILTDARGTAIRGRYWGGTISNCVVRNVINGGAQDATAILRLYNSGRTTTLVDLTVTNIATSASRLLFIDGGASLALRKCLFRGITLTGASSDAVFNLVDHSLTVTDCVFDGITWPGSNNNEGGMLRSYNYGVTLDRCVFANLRTSSSQDAIVCLNRNSPAIVRNSLFYSIATGASRPAIGHFRSDPLVHNCTIDGVGVAFRVTDDGAGNTIHVYNSSVSFCTNLNAANGARLRLHNVNLYNTATNVGYDLAGSGGVTGVDPEYRDRAGGNFRPRSSSLLIDRGATNALLGLLDLALTPRVQGVSVDLGCYETVAPHGLLFTVQ